MTSFGLCKLLTMALYCIHDLVAMTMAGSSCGYYTTVSVVKVWKVIPSARRNNPCHRKNSIGALEAGITSMSNATGARYGYSELDFLR